jgi:uncharacterized protein (TIGR03000 family)
MTRQLGVVLRGAILATAGLLLGWGAAQGHGYRGGYYRGGYYHGGYYHGYYHGYGYYRPYGWGGWGWWGPGPFISIGIYRPYYVYGPPVYVTSAAPAGAAAPAADPGAPPNGGSNAPAPDNAAHLQLLVPEGAEVWVGDSKTTKTGTTREFASPPLTPGKTYTYQVTVRYRDAAGKLVNDRRAIQVRANDWFSVDFTKPEPERLRPPDPAENRP